MVRVMVGTAELILKVITVRPYYAADIEFTSYTRRGHLIKFTKQGYPVSKKSITVSYP